MSEILDTRQPIGYLDSDTEDRLLPPSHYREGINGRSGTSDKDSVGAVEGIRGNKLVAFGTTGEKRIGACDDKKNNAIIRFIANDTAPSAITYSGASVVTTSPLLVVIANPNNPILVGAFISVLQGGPNTFVGQVTVIFGNFYTLHLVHGTPTTAAITSITRSFYNYIKRFNVSTAQDEFLINPVLMSSILGWTTATRIYNPRVIEAGFTQLLVWTDPIPRLIDIDKMRQG